MGALDTMLLRDQWEGFGTESQERVADLLKAMVAQEGVTDYASLRGAGSLMPQSLETSMIALTWGMEEIKLWKQIGIQKAFSTVEEYVKQEGYGEADATGGAVQQMENPVDADPEMARGVLRIKFMRQMWRVGDVLMNVRTITNAETLAVQASMMRLIRGVERQLFFGNSAMVPEQFDGMLKAITDLGTTNNDNYVDLRGVNISETAMRQAAEVIRINYGAPKRMYLSTGTQNTIDQLLSGSSFQRIEQNQLPASGEMSLGWTIKKMRTSFGTFDFEPDIFLSVESQGVPMVKNPTTGVLQEGATSTQAPAIPTLAAGAVAPVVAGSLWAASGSGGRIAGSYVFRVVAINRFGKSRASVAASATVAATGAISLTITEGGGAYPATAYEIYATPAPTLTSAAVKLMTTVAVTGVSQTVRDMNVNLPGTGVAFLVDDTSVGDHRVFAFKQILPVHRTSYAKVAPYNWGTTSLYGAPVWYAPRRIVVFKNIGVGARYRNENLDL